MLSRELNRQQQELYLQEVSSEKSEGLTFIWKTQRCFLIKRSMLVCQPNNYYIVFENWKNHTTVKEYFPNCGKFGSNSINESEKELRQLRHWLDSIRRTFSRSSQIVVSIAQGNNKRIKFNKYAKEL
jgi:hypothetical protein